MDPIKLNIVLERDGNAWCAHYEDFINLQESPAAFGDTTFEAVIKLLCHPESVTRL